MDLFQILINAENCIVRARTAYNAGAVDKTQAELALLSGMIVTELKAVVEKPPEPEPEKEEIQNKPESSAGFKEVPLRRIV